MSAIERPRHLSALVTGLLFVCAVAGFGASAAESETEPLVLEYADTFEQSWRAEVRGFRGTASAGETLRLSLDWQLDSRLLAENPDTWKELHLFVWGERLYDAEGRYRQQCNMLMSGLLTPSGFAVESCQTEPASGPWGTLYGSPIEGSVTLGRSELADLPRAIRSIEIPVRFSADTPDGLYRLRVAVGVKHATFPLILPLANHAAIKESRLFAGSTPGVVVGGDKLVNLFLNTTYLPPVKVGSPKTPRLVTSLFSETVSRGVKGILSEEDKQHFALSYRTRLGDALILPPGEHALAVSPVGPFPKSVVTGYTGGASHVPERIPAHLDATKGRVSFAVTSPAGETTRYGPFALTGIENGRFRWDGPQQLEFAEFGRYAIEMAGTTRDVAGNEYRFGGRYGFYTAMPLSFSTAAKIGTSFAVGGSFPYKVQVHPRVPAWLEARVRYYPNSDASRVREKTHRGHANSFGYFFPYPDEEPLVFDEPGEYRVDILASHVDERGSLWMGGQSAGGVVVGSDQPIRLHGLRANHYGPSRKDPLLGFQDRFVYRDENSMMRSQYVEFADCQNLPAPFHNGDTMFIATTLDGVNNMMASLSQSFQDPAEASIFSKRLARTFFHARRMRVTNRTEHFPEVLQFMGYDGTYYLRDVVDGAQQFPLMSFHEKGWNPANFPEGASLLNYSYYTAIRPGFPAFTLVSDSSAFNPYWSPSPNGFGGHFNTGPTGDLPEDVYRIDAGLVYRDLEKQQNRYARYAAEIVVENPETYRTRIVESGTEPILEAFGKDYYLFLAIEAAAMLEPGDPLALAAVLNPPVPAEVEFRMEGPSGQRYEVSGRANDIGIFASKEGLFTLDEPGVYTVHGKGTYKGKEGWAFGVAERPYYHFVADPKREPILEVDLPPVSHFDSRETVSVDLGWREPLSDVEVTWVVMCPGIVMDAGRAKVEGDRFSYRFAATQFAMQFPNYQVVDYETGEPLLSKTTLMAFFVEGKDASGRKRHDVRYVMVREDQMYNLPTIQRPNPLSARALGNEPPRLGMARPAGTRPR